MNQKQTSNSKPNAYMHTFIGVVAFSFSLIVGTILLMASILAVFPPIRLTNSVSAGMSAWDETSRLPLSLAAPRSVLDGSPLATGAHDSFPVAIMIENLPVVRPQAGLGSAVIVYETLVEGGATRFLAIFGRLPNTRIGPVRSARHYYVEWAHEYGALYAHAGGSPQAYALIPKFSSLFDMDALRGIWAPYFFRDHARSAPHNLFTNGELLARALRDRGLLNTVPVITAWKFLGDAADLHETVSGKSLSIDFSPGTSFDVEWRYHDGLKKYERWNGGQAHTDSETGVQISAANVVVQFTPPERSLGEKGRIDISTAGSGRALIFRGGTAVDGTWTYDEAHARTTFFDADQKEIQFLPGPTWVEVVPGDRKVELGE